jgi:hypothetical protein
MLVSRWRGKSNNALFLGMENIGEDGRMKSVEDVDVKDLLSLGRVIVEHKALNAMLKEHASDLALGMEATYASEEAIVEQALAEELLEEAAEEVMMEEAVAEKLAEEEVEGLRMA